MKAPIEFAFILGFHGHDFPPDGATRLLHFAQFVDRCSKIGIDQYRNDTSPGDQLKQHLHALRAEPVAEERQARQVAVRPIEAGDEAISDRIVADHEHDWNGRGGAPGRLHRWAIADDHRHLAADQIGREARQPIDLIVRPALLDRHVLAFYEPRLAQALAECRHDMRERLSR